MTGQSQRVDRWLWFARFFKTRTLAAKLVAAGKVRVNGERIIKPSYMVTVTDVLTFAQQERIRVVRILAPGTRRGPFAEARELYEDLSPPAETGPAGRDDDMSSGRPRGAGRPTKKERRDLDDWLDKSK